MPHRKNQILICAGRLNTNGGNTTLGNASSYGGQLIAYGGGAGAGEMGSCGFTGATVVAPALGGSGFSDIFFVYAIHCYL